MVTAMKSSKVNRPVLGKYSFSRKMVPGVLVIMLAGIIFPFITADNVSSPAAVAPDNTGSTTIGQTNLLKPSEYADPEQTASLDLDPMNRSKSDSAAAGAVLVPWLIPLYSKLSPDAVLANGSRAQLYNLVNSQPGITFGTLARTLSMAPGTAEYHLRILEREGYLRSRKCGKFIKYYPYQMKTSPYTPVQQKIVNSLAIEPDLSQTDLAEKVGVSKQVVNYNVKQLREFGILEEQKQGTKILVKLNSNSHYSPHAF